MDGCSCARFSEENSLFLVARMFRGGNFTRPKFNASAIMSSPDSD
jgi:hypothetical protein